MARRFRTRLYLTFAFGLALVGTGTVALALAPSNALEAFGLGLAVLLVVGFVAGRGVRWLSRPVEIVADATRRFGQGELGHRIVIPPRVERWMRRRRGQARAQRHEPVDELYGLAVAWNDMADRIERLIVAQKELLANVSHELRSPLARMRVALELVPKSAVSSPEVHARLAEVERDLADLDRLIDDVLTTSRLDVMGTSGFSARLELTSLAGLFEDLGIRAAADPRFVGKPITVSIDPGFEPVVVDPALLRRALWNLLENAAKYGSPPIEVHVDVDGAAVIISVEDHGPGIPPADRERIFEAFQRGDRARTPGGEPGGFGLGLTLARRVAEVHRGYLALDPNVRGTRMVLALPRASQVP